MTDARMPEKWLADRRIRRLSDSGFRLFVTALLWSVANRTDGIIFDDDVCLIDGTDSSRAAELEKVGLWRKTADKWTIVDFELTQTSRNELTVLENARKRDRERKARQRARRSEEPVPGDCPGGHPGDGSMGQHRIGQDRQGQDLKAHLGDQPTTEVARDTWEPRVDVSWADRLYDRE